MSKWVQKKSCPLGLSEWEKGIKLTTQPWWNEACLEHLGLLSYISQTMNNGSFKYWSNSARSEQDSETSFFRQRPLLWPSETILHQLTFLICCLLASQTAWQNQVLWYKKYIVMYKIFVAAALSSCNCHDRYTCKRIYARMSVWSFTLVPSFFLCSLTKHLQYSIVVYIRIWLALHPLTQNYYI